MIKVNKHISKLKPSSTLAINQEALKLRAENQDVVHFGFGQSPFPVHNSIVKSLKKNASKSAYLPTIGLEPLRQQIETFLKKHQSVAANSDYIFIGPGSKELLYQTILLLEGIFLIPKGSWVSYGPQIDAKGSKYEILETSFQNDFKLEANLLETYLKTNEEEQHILILNSPNNPTGAVYTDKELKSLAEVCKAYNVIVLSDEIYSQVNFNSAFSPSISSFYPEKTIVFGGLSKVFSAGGYRLGFMVLPPDMYQLKDAFRSMFSETFSAVSAPVQYAAIKAYKMKSKLAYTINENNTILKHISQFIYNQLQSIGIECTNPQGAFYMMIGFNNFKKEIADLNINTSTELAVYLLKEYKVALLPGVDFYFDEDEFFFRLAFVDFKIKNNHNLKLDNNFDENYIAKHFPNIVKGVSAIRMFVNDIK